MSNFLSPHSSGKTQCVDTPERMNFLVSNCGAGGARGVNVLGRGGFGIVLKAMYRGERVAVKVVHLHHQHSRQSLANEANILGWRHPNITHIFKIVSDPNHGLVIMERISGDNLQSVLNAVRIGTLAAVEILSQVSSGLTYCHQQGVIHSDLKPQNILITLTGDESQYLVKLCDFGSSYRINENPSDCRGTIRYMAPEALKGAPLTPKADIFSFGVIMWQIEKRRVPYEEIRNNDIIAYRVVREGLRPDTSQKSFTLKIPEILLNGGESESGRSISPRMIKSETLKRSDENSPGILPRSLNALLKEAHIENHEKISITEKIPWKRIFKVKKWTENEEMSSNYRNLSQICWHDDPLCRPEASHLHSKLQQLISLSN